MKTLISAVAAMDRDGVIGTGAGLPWRNLPRDAARFRRLTLGKPIIMGFNTFMTLPAPLECRYNIVMTRKTCIGCQYVALNIHEALAEADRHNLKYYGNEAVIVGGGQIFEQTVPLWDWLHLTIVNGRFAGSVKFPLTETVASGKWEIFSHEYWLPDERNRHPMSFISIRRMTPERAEQLPGLVFDLNLYLEGLP